MRILQGSSGDIVELLGICFDFYVLTTPVQIVEGRDGAWTTAALVRVRDRAILGEGTHQDVCVCVC